MSPLDPVILILAGLGLLSLAVFAALAVLRAVRARRRARRRVVEKPNSHYTSPVVRENETRNRWQNIALDRIHEINREEVVRLLAKAEISDGAALRANERAFLDYMVELAGTRPPPPPPQPREKGKQLPPELRHRPA